MPQTTHRIVGVLELTALDEMDATQFNDLQWEASSRFPDNQLNFQTGSNLLADVLGLDDELRAEHREHAKMRQFALV